MSNTHTLTLDRLTKQYGSKLAVDRISYKLQNGIYGLLGANGAGKTTLMRLICGIQKPTSGDILYDNTPISELGEIYRDRLGYLPQQFGYYPNLTPEKFLQYMSSLKGISKGDAKILIDKLLAEVGLTEVRKKKIRTFSGGMKRRLGIAQAMLNDPDILILDEPTAGLDPQERVKFRDLIATFANNKIVLLSTHIVSDIECIAGKILVMRSGEFIHDGSLPELLKILDGKVWSVKADAFKPGTGSVNRAKLGIMTVQGETRIRVVSDTAPSDDAINEAATLEDLYLYYFGSDQNEVRV